MKHRIFIIRPPGMAPQGWDPLGCLLYILGLAGLAVLGVFVLLPLLGMAFGIGLGIVAIGTVVVLYYRARAWLRCKLGGGEKSGLADESYKAEVLDDQTDDADRGGAGASAGRPRLTVEVRRRPHRE